MYLDSCFVPAEPEHEEMKWAAWYSSAALTSTLACLKFERTETSQFLIVLTKHDIIYRESIEKILINPLPQT